jgi:hypothetical protein
MTTSTVMQDPVKVSSTDSTLESTQDGDDTSGRVGLAAQQQGANARAAINAPPGPRSTTKETENETRNIVPGEVTEKEFARYPIEDARVTYALPKNMGDK